MPKTLVLLPLLPCSYHSNPSSFSCKSRHHFKLKTILQYYPQNTYSKHNVKRNSWWGRIKILTHSTLTFLPWSCRNHALYQFESLFTIHQTLVFHTLLQEEKREELNTIHTSLILNDHKGTSLEAYHETNPNLPPWFQNSQNHNPPSNSSTQPLDIILIMKNHFLNIFMLQIPTYQNPRFMEEKRSWRIKQIQASNNLEDHIEYTNRSLSWEEEDLEGLVVRKRERGVREKREGGEMFANTWRERKETRNEIFLG